MIFFRSLSISETTLYTTLYYSTVLVSKFLSSGFPFLVLFSCSGFSAFTSSATNNHPSSALPASSFRRLSKSFPRSGASHRLFIYKLLLPALLVPSPALKKLKVSRSWSQVKNSNNCRPYWLGNGGNDGSEDDGPQRTNNRH